VLTLAALASLLPARASASAEEMRRELVAALKACPAPAPDADTVMFERLNAER
jgi:hypothetical protein